MDGLVRVASAAERKRPFLGEILRFAQHDSYRGRDSLFGKCSASVVVLRIHGRSASGRIVRSHLAPSLRFVNRRIKLRTRRRATASARRPSAVPACRSADTGTARSGCVPFPSDSLQLLFPSQAEPFFCARRCALGLGNGNGPGVCREQRAVGRRLVYGVLHDR